MSSPHDCVCVCLTMGVNTPPPNKCVTSGLARAHHGGAPHYMPQKRAGFLLGVATTAAGGLGGYGILLVVAKPRDQQMALKSRGGKTQSTAHTHTHVVARTHTWKKLRHLFSSTRPYRPRTLVLYKSARSG